MLVRTHDRAVQKHLLKVRCLGQFGEHPVPEVIVGASGKDEDTSETASGWLMSPKAEYIFAP